MYLLTQYLIKAKGFIQKRQALFVLLSVLIPMAIGTVTNGILPLLNIYILPAAVLLASITAPIVVYAIFRYGLFEVSSQAILSSINHAIITVDNKGHILQMNSFSERMLGVKLAMVSGTSIDDILRVQHTPKSRTNYLNRLLTQVIYKGSAVNSNIYSIINNKQRIFPYTISITPVQVENNVVGANIMLRDTHKEKEREKQKDDFINIVSHELKTPITSIKAYNQLLAKQIVINNEHGSELVTKIDDQLNRLTRLINDFFELSRVQSGKLKLQREYLSIDDIVYDVVDTLQVAYGNQKIRVEGHTDQLIFVDKDRITQVIINLVTNAIKYSPENKHVVIGLQADKKRVTISIKDFGKGIPKEFQKRIFSQFYQINSSSHKNQGLGLGLFIASYIVKMHGGKIWVESKEKKGSTFYFSLPVSE